MSENYQKTFKINSIFSSDSSKEDIRKNSIGEKCLFCGIFKEDPKIIGTQIKRPNTPFDKTNQVNGEILVNDNYDLYINYQRAYIEVDEIYFTLEQNI